MGVCARALHSKVAFALPAVQKIKSSKNFKIGRGVSSGEYDIKRNARPARYRPLPPPNRHQREPIRDHETSFDLLLRKEEPGYKFLTLDRRYFNSSTQQKQKKNKAYILEKINLSNL